MMKRPKVRSQKYEKRDSEEPKIRTVKKFKGRLLAEEKTVGENLRETGKT